MVATNADCSIWLNHSLRTETWPKIRSKSGSSAARSSRVSFTSKTQTLFTTFLSQQRSAKESPSREPRQAEMLTSEDLKGPKRADKARSAVLTSEARKASHADRLKCYLGAAFQAERLACLVRGGWLSVEHLTQSHGLLDQLGVRLRALFAADTEIVFQADSD